MALQSIALRDFALLNVPSRTRLRGHTHDAAHLCIVTSGGFEDTTSRVGRRLNAGEMRLSPPAKRDLAFDEVGATCVVADIGDEFETPLRAEQCARAPTWALALLDDVAAHASAFEQKLVLSDIVSAFRWHRASRTSPPSWLIEVRDALHEPGAPALVLDIAKRSGVHRVHLSRSFRAFFGVPLTVYHQRVKLQRVLHLLPRSDHTLTDVALAAGYFDQAHLARWTSRYFDCPPGELRRRLHSSKSAGRRWVRWP